MKTIEETYRARLQMLIDEYGGQAKLSEAINKSASQISQWLNATPDSRTGKPRSLKSETAREIEIATGKPRAWFDQPLDSVMMLGDAYIVPEGYIKFSVLNVKAKMGAGTLDDSPVEVVDFVAVAESWAKAHFGGAISRIHIITGTDDSMSGTIEPDEILFVDTGIDYFDGDGLYVIHTPAGRRAKRLQMTLTGVLLIISDNPKYRDEEVRPEDVDNIHIIGKIKGSWGFKQFR